MQLKAFSAIVFLLLVGQFSAFAHAVDDHESALEACAICAALPTEQDNDSFLPSPEVWTTPNAKACQRPMPRKRNACTITRDAWPPQTGPPSV